MSQSESDSIKSKVRKWAEKDGLRHVQYKLIREGVSFSLAYQLTSGRYKSELKEAKKRAIRRVLPL